MSTDTSDNTDVSITHLVTGIISDAQDLGVKHLELLRSEVLQEIRKTTDALLAIAIGFALALIGGVIFCHMFAHLLIQSFPSLTTWQAYGIVGLVTIVIGAIPMASGVSKLRALQISSAAAVRVSP